MLDVFFFLPCFSARRRIPGDESPDRTLIIVKKFFLPFALCAKVFFLWKILTVARDARFRCHLHVIYKYAASSPQLSCAGGREGGDSDG